MHIFTCYLMKSKVNVLMLQDPLAWSDVTSFDLTEGGPSPKAANPTDVCTTLERCTESLAYPINASIVPVMSRQCAVVNQGKSVALSNTCMNRFSSPPPSIMRKKRRERRDQSPADERSCAYMDNSGNSPKNTPVKGLPFSPSQVWLDLQHKTSFRPQDCVDSFKTFFPI